jgi:general secretion pathway protein E
MVSRLSHAHNEKVSEQLAHSLLGRGTLTEAQLAYARQKQKIERRPLWHVLIDNGLARERDVTRAVSELQGLEFTNVDDLPPPERDVLALFNRDLCLNASFLPLRREADRLVVLLGDATPMDVEQVVLRRCGARCRFLQADFSRVGPLIRQSFFFAQNPIEDLIDRELRSLAADHEGVRSPEELLNHLLHLAVRERATDIHVAPASGSLHVLMRVDGVMRPMLAMPSQLVRLMSYIKLISEMDISEQRRPQDGSFRTRILDVPFAIRVSTIVTEHGERMVMRLLPESHDLKGLSELGFYPEHAEVITQAMQKPSGLIIITGPTGSGKSSTLHAGLRMQQLIERNVLTVEDPVEYRVPGAGQTEVNRKAGYDFKVALRHFLRHDPDVILVGEMRDAETAVAALDASATGHLVLSTLHVTTVFGVLPRLRPMGLQPQVIAENLLLVINQRLVRRNCPACAQVVAFTEAERRWLGSGAPLQGRRGPGCAHCRETGYHGRVPVYELLPIDDRLSDLIAQDARRSALRQAADEQGFEDLVACGKRRVCDGLTTPEEVGRALGDGP